MGTFLLILIVGYDAAVLEFPSQKTCVQAQKELVQEVKNEKFAANCFKKIGGKNKNA